MTFAEGTRVAGVYTCSTTPGAPVTWCKQALRECGGTPRVLLVSAGNANVFTGTQGLQACAAIAQSAGERYGCGQHEVLLCATGVIGEALPFDKVISALSSISLSTDCWTDAASAIVTTDTFPKAATRAAEIGGSTVTLNGIAKGSGMIEPNMATMLAYIVTDANLNENLLQSLLVDANEQSFNAITVDSDTSTSDTVLLCATAQAAHEAISDAADPRLDNFKTALLSLMTELAQLVVRDGEGATKFVTVSVTGAVDDAAAKRVAKSIANSPLVKTAIAGEDANWGRVVMAVGKSGEVVTPETLEIRFGGNAITANGALRADYNESIVAQHLKGQEIDLHVDLGVGSGQATVWTCDLTHGYISINADYRS